MQGNLADSASLNPYAYAGCNPANTTDPTGRYPGQCAINAIFNALNPWNQVTNVMKTQPMDQVALGVGIEALTMSTAVFIGAGAGLAAGFAALAIFIPAGFIVGLALYRICNT
jgi:hypothetical protein